MTTRPTEKTHLDAQNAYERTTVIVTDQAGRKMAELHLYPDAIASGDVETIMTQIQRAVEGLGDASQIDLRE